MFPITISNSSLNYQDLRRDVNGKRCTNTIRRLEDGQKNISITTKVPKYYLMGVGHIVSFSDSIARLSGLCSVGMGEVILVGKAFEYAGIVFSLTNKIVGVTLVSRIRTNWGIRIGTPCKATGRSLTSRF